MIITIGRQHGSSGREIARLLAKELGIKCYDKEIVDEAAKHSDFSRELINACLLYTSPSPRDCS